MSPTTLSVPPWPEDLLDVLPTAVYVCDADGVIVRFNRRAAEIWGRSPRIGRDGEKFCGSHRLYSLGGRALAHARCPMADVLRTGIAVRNAEVVIERPAGDHVIALVNIDPLLNEAGRVVGAVNSLVDVSALKGVEERLRVDRLELEDFFDNGEVALHWVGPAGTILRANQAELDLLGYEQEEYVGRHIAEFHADTDAVQDILSRLRRGEKLDEYPARLLTKSGAIRHVLITSSVYFRDGQFVHTRCFTIDVTARRKAERALQDGEKRWRELLEALPAAVYTTDAQGRITFYNDAAADIWGTRPELGKSEWCGSWRLYWPDGAPLRHDECPMAVALKDDRPIRNIEAVAERPDGTRIPFMPYPTPLHDASGRLVGAVNMLIDLRHLKEAQGRQQLLIHELNHRVKNTLATVQSIAHQTFRGKIDDHVQRWFDGRLIALAKTHDVLTRESWQGADLQEITAQAVEFACDHRDRVTVNGSKLMLPPRMIVPLAMALHELCTNASKYGALSCAAGRVSIGWQRSPAGDRVLLEWIERDGPPVRQPAHRGFGTRFLERGLAHELKADVEISYLPSGLACKIDFPLDACAPVT